MKLRDYLTDNGIRQIDFAKKLDVDRCHLSSIVSGNRNPSKKLARNIERETHGAIRQEDVLSGKALGYEGKPKRVKMAAVAINNNYELSEKVLPKNVYSLI